MRRAEDTAEHLWAVQRASKQSVRGTEPAAVTPVEVRCEFKDDMQRGATGGREQRAM